jgi:hypothetical protein
VSRVVYIGDKQEKCLLTKLDSEFWAGRSFPYGRGEKPSPHNVAGNGVDIAPNI